MEFAPPATVAPPSAAPPTATIEALFARTLIDWQRQHGRHSLPWQGQGAYAVWLSEIMLQQTRVESVIPYYERFLTRFPDLASLAAAPLDEVLALWSGLGYYARARNLHRCARIVVAEHGGEFPRHAAALQGLPGIGRSTAAAIAAFVHGERVAILDGNVRRVLCRVFGLEGIPGSAALDTRLWALAERLLPSSPNPNPHPPALDQATELATYTQAQMDLGATCCLPRKPKCASCPLAELCVAHRSGRETEFPQRKPRKPPPLRLSPLLVLRWQDQILVERRPPLGIWGGLESLPELAALADEKDAELEIQAHFQQRLIARIQTLIPGAQTAPAQALPPLRHALTHFRLELQPWLIDLQAPPPPRSMSGGLRWLNATELANTGLPAPIRTLLGQLPRSNRH